VEAAEKEATGFSRLSTGSPTKSSFGKRKQKKSVASSARNRALAGAKASSGKNEIFVDLLEQLTVLFDARGNVQRMEIDGHIQMKSYLQGLPELSIGLNEDLAVGQFDTNSPFAIPVQFDM
jgi:hypothetical protein